MKEPTPLLGEAAFRAAIAKGQGRTMLALREPDGPVLYEDAILDACLHHRQFRFMGEANRTPYLFGLAVAAGLQDRLFDALLERLSRPGEEWDRDRILDLLGEYVERGDERAWNALMACREEEGAQIRLAESGERGLAWYTERILPAVPVSELWRLRSWLPDNEAEDQTETQRTLRAKQKEYEAYWKAYRENHPEPLFAPHEFLERLGQERLRITACWRFAEEASDEEIDEAAERFLDETETRPIQELMWVFEKTWFPFPEDLLAQADDAIRGWAVCEILATRDHPEVRAFALDLIRQRPLPWNATAAIRCSFRPGDETVFRELLPDAESYTNRERHNIVGDLISLMPDHKEVDWQPFAEWIVEHSPCSFCRNSAIRWMIEQGILPNSIREEARYDAEPDTRELVGK